MKDLWIAVPQVQQVLDAHQWRRCLIGGLAVLQWGEPRLTQAVDGPLLTGLGEEERLC